MEAEYKDKTANEAEDPILQLKSKMDGLEREVKQLEKKTNGIAENVMQQICEMIDTSSHVYLPKFEKKLKDIKTLQE